MEINAAAEAIDQFLRTYKGAGGGTPAEVQVRPSGDDMTAIKVWVNLGADAASIDPEAWAAAAEQAIRAKVGDELAPYVLEIRVDTF
jgi:hypothetical protein